MSDLLCTLKTITKKGNILETTHQMKYSLRLRIQRLRKKPLEKNEITTITFPEQDTICVVYNSNNQLPL